MQKMNKEKHTMKDPDANIVAQFGKNHGFQAPEYYFDQLPSKIQERIAESKEVKKISMAQLLMKPQFIAAYTIVLLIGLFFIFSPLEQYTDSERNENVKSGLIAEQIMIVEDFDESAILSAMDDETFSSEQMIENKAISILGSDDELSDDEIISYLSDEELGELTAYLP